MPKKKYKKPKDVSNEPIQLSLFDLPDNLPDPDSLSEPANCYEDAELSQPDSLLESSDASQSKEDNSRGESFSAIPERLFVPDRFESLENRAKHQLENFIVPVETALAHLDETYSDMRSAGRGAFWVFRGNSGSGKSTFLHTVNLFRPQVKTISIRAEQSVPDTLRELRNSRRSLNELRILVLEGREALTDFSEEELEKNLHAINSFIRSDSGRDTLIVWPCNSDPLEEKLIDLAARLGAESLLGVGDRSYRFQGSPQNQYLDIAKRTISTLNDEASLIDLGVTEQRAQELINTINTIGAYLNLLRKEFLANKKELSEKLQATEQCRLWTVVIAGNDPEKDVASLTRGRSSTADIERLMVATNANVVKELKSYPDKIGILGTMLDARIIPLPILTVLSVVRKYASDALRAKMKEVSMDTRSVDSIKKTSKRLRNSELARALNSETIGLGRSGQAPGSNTIESFEKLAKIARTNDELANKALGQGLQDEGLIRSFKTEVDLGNGLTRRTDLVCETEFGKVRIEVMWRKKTSRADIANYVLQKVQNYGRALGFLN